MLVTTKHLAYIAPKTNQQPAIIPVIAMRY